MRKANKQYITDYGCGDMWSVYGKVFYTVEHENSEYLDFYDEKDSFLSALKTGTPNEKRVESIPNVFKNDETEKTFNTICAVFEACGDLKKTFDTIYEIFKMTDDGRLVYKE